MQKVYFTLFSALLLFYSCTLKYEKEAWAVALNSSTNQTELVEFLQHYKDLSDKKRYKAACFLIRNMPDNTPELYQRWRGKQVHDFQKRQIGKQIINH